MLISHIVLSFLCTWQSFVWRGNHLNRISFTASVGDLFLIFINVSTRARPTHLARYYIDCSNTMVLFVWFVNQTSRWLIVSIQLGSAIRLVRERGAGMKTVFFQSRTYGLGSTLCYSLNLQEHCSEQHIEILAHSPRISGEYSIAYLLVYKSAASCK